MQSDIALRSAKKDQNDNTLSSVEGLPIQTQYINFVLNNVNMWPYLQEKGLESGCNEL